MIVFVSYSSTNRDAVEALVLQLGELGHDVEYEAKFVGAPITWRHIFGKITGCDLFITAVTRETLVSSTCEIEYQYARTLNKNILAVLLEDLSTEDLPNMRVKGLVDFRASTPFAQAELAGAIDALPIPAPPPTMVVPSANWVTPLAELRKRIENLRRDAREQRAVVLNIKEFLERRESFEVATSLLDLLAVQSGLRQLTIGQIQYIRDELKRVRSLTRGARRRRTFVSAIVLSSVVALIAVIFSQLFFRFRANYNVELSLTRTAENIAASDIGSSVLVTTTPAASTATLVPTIIFSSTPADIQPTAVAEISNPAAPISLSTNTPLIPASTATPAPPTEAILPSSTPSPTLIPPTATATMTLLPGLTQMPPTQAVSFASSNSTIVDVANRLPRNAYVGLTVEDTPFGVKVSRVGATARSVGVQVGDYVLAVDLDIVTTQTQFLRTMQARNPSSRITLRVRRGGDIVLITLVLGADDFISVTSTP